MENVNILNHIKFFEEIIIPLTNSGNKYELNYAANKLQTYMEENEDLVRYFEQKMNIASHLLIHQDENYIRSDSQRFLSLLKQ